MGYETRPNLDGLTLHDALGGSLPSVDLLTSVFDSRLHPRRKLIDRASAAIDQADFYMDQLNAAEGLILPQRDILSALYLDSVRLMGARQLLNGNLSQEETPNNPFKKDTSHRTLSKRINAGHDMQQRIGQLRQIYQGAEDRLIYKTLETLMYDAACLIINKEDLSRHSEGLVRAELTGILAEYKVAEAFRSNGFPLTHYASAGEDMNDKHDIIVYLGREHKHHCMPLQVRSNSARSYELTIGEGENGALLVEVPMGRDGSQLELQPDDAQFLVTTVSRRGIEEADRRYN